MHMRDSEVVSSIVAGDPDGLATAYYRYADPLYKYCRTLLSDPADAADAVQDTFVIAASRLAGLRDPERLRAWLYAVARNQALRIQRAGRGPSALDEAPAATDDAPAAAERASLRALLEDAADGLNPGERELIELQLRQGLEPAEVATVLGVSRGHARTLLSRARDQLETCLGVLLVARAGRAECGELAAQLTGWDGRLTVLLRKRIHRHIEHCATCGTRRAFELSPAMLLDLSPGAALTAGAVESYRLAASAPEGLKAHTITLATGQGPDAAAHRTAVLGRAGVFTRHGFPAAAPSAGKAGLAGSHGAGGLLRGGLLRGGLRSSPQARAIVAVAVVLAAIIAAIAVKLADPAEHVKLASAPPGPTTAVVPATASQPPTPTGNATAGAAVAATATGTAAAAAPTGTTAPVSLPGSAPTSAQPATSPPATPTTAPPAPAPPPPPPAPTTTTTTRSPSPGPSPSASPSATPPPGTLSDSPPGGTPKHPQSILVLPGSVGTPIYLRTSGATVTWSVTIANDPAGVVSVSPSASGTLTSGQPTATVTISVSQQVPCGKRSGTACPTITISPGGGVYSIWTGWSRRSAADGLTAAYGRQHALRTVARNASPSTGRRPAPAGRW